MSEEEKIYHGMTYDEYKQAWDFVSGFLENLHYNAAEVLHMMVHYATRADHGQVLREIREELKPLNYPPEVKDFLGKEQVGSFLEYEYWFWKKEIDKKYYSVVDLLRKYKVEPDDAKELIVLGLYVDGKISLSKAAELYGLTLGTFIELLAEKGIPAVRYTMEMLEEDMQGVDEIVGKKSKVVIDDANTIPKGMSEEEQHVFWENHVMSEQLLEESYIEDDSDLPLLRRERDKKDIEKAMKNAKATLKMDGFVIYKGQEQLVLDRLSGKITEEEFLKKSLELAKRDENE